MERLTSHPFSTQIRSLRITSLLSVILATVIIGLCGCDMLGLSNRLDIRIIVHNQNGEPISGLRLKASKAPFDMEIGVMTPGQIAWHPGDGSKLTDDMGTALFENIRKGNIFLIIETAHWEVFPARTGPVFTKEVILNR